VVEAEAAAHADDRWWVLAPAMLVEHRDGAVDRVPLAGRTLPRVAELRDLPGALGVRRVACALHVDLLVGADRFPAIVLAVAGTMTTAYAYAAVQRTDTGTPYLGGWVAGPDLAEEIGAALGSAAAS